MKLRLKRIKKSHKSSMVFPRRTAPSPLVFLFLLHPFSRQTIYKEFVHSWGLLNHSPLCWEETRRLGDSSCSRTQEFESSKCSFWLCRLYFFPFTPHFLGELNLDESKMKAAESTKKKTDTPKTKKSKSEDKKVTPKKAKKDKKMKHKSN